MRDEYIALLKKLCNNKDVLNIFSEVVLDSHRVKEQCYVDTGTYPTPRELLGKLQQDLANTKKAMKEIQGKDFGVEEEYINARK